MNMIFNAKLINCILLTLAEDEKKHLVVDTKWLLRNQLYQIVFTKVLFRQHHVPLRYRFILVYVYELRSVCSL